MYTADVFNKAVWKKIGKFKRTRCKQRLLIDLPGFSSNLHVTTQDLFRNLYSSKADIYLFTYRADRQDKLYKRDYKNRLNNYKSET